MIDDRSRSLARRFGVASLRRFRRIKTQTLRRDRREGAENTEKRRTSISLRAVTLSFVLSAALALGLAPTLRAQDSQAGQQDSQRLAPNAAPPDAQTAIQLTPEQVARAKSLGKRVKCMCGGCDDAAGLCTHSGGAFAGPCDTAKAELKEIDQRVARGDSDSLILQSFVQEYGPTVLIEPPKAGFDWLAWIMPVLFPFVALLLVWQVVRKWHRRAALAPASGPPLSAEMMDRARREADKESDE
ncbi:MAG: cytochrome c-type biogenesis protein CcmH [Candidatus Acidiferrales bacterium]